MNKNEDDIKKKYQNIIRQKELMYKQYEEKLDEANKYANNLSQLLIQKNSKIEELEFNLKIIRLRIAYKSFIDLFIYLFDLEDKRNLDENRNIIKGFLNKYQKGKAQNIVNLVNDIYDLIQDANKEAHDIDFREKLFIQLLNGIAKYTDNNDYLKVIEVLEKFNIEKLFKDLVKVRTKKFEMDYDVFKNEGKNIIDNIRKNKFNSTGLSFLNK